MRSIAIVILLLLAGLVFAVWHYQAHLLAFITSPSSAANSAGKPDVLYSWADKDGVTHFEQQAGKGVAVSYDGSRITPMGRVGTATPAEKENTSGEVSGNPVFTVREELLENAKIMRKEKNRQAGIEE